MVNDVETKVITSFRGSVGMPQLKAQMFLSRTLENFECGGRIGRFYNLTFQSSFCQAIGFKKLRIITSRGDFDRQFHGYSMGAVFSLLAALTAANELKCKKIRHIGFAQPRFGDMDFVQIYTEKVPFSFRITMRRDPIVSFPPRTAVSNTYLYTQTINELYYCGGPLTRQSVKCTELEQECSTSSYPSGTNTQDIDQNKCYHEAYFTGNLEIWGEGQCPKQETVKPYLSFCYSLGHVINNYCKDKKNGTKIIWSKYKPLRSVEPRNLGDWLSKPTLTSKATRKALRLRWTPRPPRTFSPRAQPMLRWRRETWSLALMRSRSLSTWENTIFSLLRRLKTTSRSPRRTTTAPTMPPKMFKWFFCNCAYCITVKINFRSHLAAPKTIHIGIQRPLLSDPGINHACARIWPLLLRGARRRKDARLSGSGQLI
ncbi:hypothetical protein L596_010161 [Steinernema carpocapsae]|uniref:Fungal lipase-type domain-containing protein n=1 Tax=Steinernema carpocapsae TaxID=34508 RepID=A0A4U5PHJ4_STECR|nr:hypothetical protein L596_010161 [Steinernema carpocapsae]